MSDELPPLPEGAMCEHVKSDWSGWRAPDCGRPAKGMDRVYDTSEPIPMCAAHLAGRNRSRAATEKFHAKMDRERQQREQQQEVKKRVATVIGVEPYQVTTERLMAWILEHHQP